MSRNVRRKLKRAVGVNWWLVRIAASDTFSDSYADVRDRWTLRELASAHRALDVVDAVKAENAPS